MQQENLSYQPDFAGHLAKQGVRLQAREVSALQVNLGKLCNQACKHCHVDAGPGRKEIMERATVEKVLAVLARWRILTLDLTGGAPELNPSFDYLVTEARKLGTHVIVRHNLTVMFASDMEYLPEFFSRQQVEVVSSLPYFLAEQTDAQRGRGVFDRSLEALRRLNKAGYGQAESGLVLNLVYNPTGAFLPAAQPALEQDFKRELFKRYGVVFNALYVLTNMPIKRFLDYLRRSGNEERYRRKLVEAFNPQTLENLMCRSLVSVSWTGGIYDCDFNQMLEIPTHPPLNLDNFDYALLRRRTIATAGHCFGCTAGSGSGCSGTLVNS